MEKELKFFYDEAGDVLDISIGKPKPAITKELENNIFIRLDPESKSVVGFMILNFKKRFKKLGHAETIPIKAEFKLKDIPASS